MIFLLNSTILLTSIAAIWICLWSASHLAFPYQIFAVLAFSLVNMTPFSVMHECVHGMGAENKRLNKVLGILAGAIFPTSFTLQKVAHLGHHRRNRTDDELYDYYLPHQSKLMRNVWMYGGNLLGLYWWSVVFSNFVYFIAPRFYKSRLFVDKVAHMLGFGPYVEDLIKIPSSHIWMELLVAAIYQACVFYFLDLSFWPTFFCYWVFSMYWSVLQYADHAWSARDTLNGAWNLEAPLPIRWLALNYFDHLAHHQHPQEPWFRLHKIAESQNSEPQPSFWRIYKSLWKGVRPAPPMGAPADLAYIFGSEKAK